MNFSLEMIRDWCYSATSNPYAAHGCYITYIVLHRRKDIDLASDFDLLLLDYLDTNYPFKISPVMISQPISRLHIRKTHHGLHYEALSLTKLGDRLLASRTNLSPDQEEHSVVYEVHQHEYGQAYKLLVRKASSPSPVDLRAYPQNLLNELYLVKQKLKGGAV